MTETKHIAGDFNRNTWVHVAALNTLADHAAGIPVDPAKLVAAQDLVDQYGGDA